MKIATWNVNSIRARLPRVLAWLEAARPDVALLQETKVTPEQFPAGPLEDLGYNLAVIGEPGGRNGVAILAKSPIEDICRTLPGDAQDQEARYLEAVVGGVRVASVYVPNGTALELAPLPVRARLLRSLEGTHAEELLRSEEPLVIGGDYNVGPYPLDVFDPQVLDGTICYHPAERASSAPCSTSACTTPTGSSSRGPGRTAGGTIRGASTGPTRGFASTICCCRRRRSTGSRRPRSTPRSAPPRRHPTTCRSGARSRDDGSAAR